MTRPRASALRPSRRSRFPRITDGPCYRPGDISGDHGRARATGPQSRDLTQARGCLLAPGHAWALARGMALRGMAGRSTPEQVATPYGGLCEHARTPMRPQDDDDPNVLTQRWPRQLAQPQVRDRLAPCPPTGRSRRDHEWIGTAAASSKESPSARCSFVEHASGHAQLAA
jgi:hypothetical protein